MVCIVLGQLFFNSVIITKLKNNFPILGLETFFQTLFILSYLAVLFYFLKIEGFFFNFLFLNELGTNISKFFLILSSIFILIIILKNFNLQKLVLFEYFNIFLLSLFSLIVLLGTADILSVYLAIEMQALAFYVLSSFNRNSAFSVEAGLKYFISGSFISGFFLMGCAILYGLLGTLNFNNLSLIFSTLVENTSFLKNLLLIGVIFITITFLFKLSAAPFHFWSPDVYEGSTIASTIIFTIIPKFVLTTLFIRWLCVLSNSFIEIKILLLLSGFLSLFLGTFFAFNQKRLKRLIIYSSLAQTGFLISGLSSLSLESVIAAYFFLVIYLITSALFWFNLSSLYMFQNKIFFFYKLSDSTLFLSSLANFFKVNKLWALSFIILFFSMGGIPPLSGFWAKIFIIFSLIDYKALFSSFYFMGNILFLSSISVYYYLRVIKIIFFEKKKENILIEYSQIIFLNKSAAIELFHISFFLFILLFLFFYPSHLLLVCELLAVSSFFW